MGRKILTFIIMFFCTVNFACSEEITLKDKQEMQMSFNKAYELMLNNNYALKAIYEEGYRMKRNTQGYVRVTIWFLMTIFLVALIMFNHYQFLKFEQQQREFDRQVLDLLQEKGIPAGAPLAEEDLVQDHH